MGIIDLSTPNEWQLIDPENGLVMPWYTHPFLEVLKTWNLKDKVVLEIGGGASTLWWATRAKFVYLIEDNSQYWNDLFGRGITNLISAKYHPNGPFDIVIVDSDPVDNRDALCAKAISVLSLGGKLIVDNWEQPSVWMPKPETKELLCPYICQIYKQPNHPDWKTAVFTKL